MSEVSNVGDVIVYCIQFARLFSSTDIQTFRNEVIDVAEKNPGAKLALDFTKVQFVSSRGLGVVVALHKSVTANDGKLVLFGISQTIREVLRTTQLDTVLTIADDQDAAIKAVGGTAG